MPLAYYSRSATTEFWTEHWGGHTVDDLLQIARGSPLTALIERHLPVTGRVLEAGCGPGHYVLLLRERGHAVVGADWSHKALQGGAGLSAPLAVMDLRALAVTTGSIAAYLSLGVVEHDPDGPDAILREAARVVPPGGALLLSVPYWNGVRRLATPYLRRQARLMRQAGGEFYQFAFSRRELGCLLEAHHFEVSGFHPYDPGRVLRKALGRLRKVASSRSPREATLAAGATGPTSAQSGPSRLREAARALLYTGPALRLFSHMLLAVAIRR